MVVGGAAPAAQQSGSAAAEWVRARVFEKRMRRHASASGVSQASFDPTLTPINTNPYAPPNAPPPLPPPPQKWNQPVNEGKRPRLR